MTYGSRAIAAGITAILLSVGSLAAAEATPQTTPQTSEQRSESHSQSADQANRMVERCTRMMASRSQ